MARVLALSSWVSAGHVGLSAAAPVLAALGHEVTQIPTMILSNHLGWPHVASRDVPPDQMRGFIDAIDENGWLDNHDAVLVGFLPTRRHVEATQEFIERLRRRPSPPFIVLDPVIGDDPKGLYVPEEVAAGLLDNLLPLANCITPNRFELEWLSGHPVTSLREALAACRSLLNAMPGLKIHGTSAPIGPNETGVLSVGASSSALFTTPRLEDIPNGTGDVFSALISGGYSVGATLGHMQPLIRGSIGAPHLRINELSQVWTNAEPISPKPLPAEQ